MNWFLTFSDSAKFAQAAVRLLSGDGLTVTHSFFAPERLSQTVFPLESFPLTSILMTLPLKLFGITDSSLIASGLILLFLTVVVLSISAYKISGRWAALLAPITFLIIPGIWDYYWNFSSEAVAMLLLSLATTLYIKKSKAHLFFYVLSMLARPQLICLPLAYLLAKRRFVLSGIAIVIIAIFGFTYRQAFVSLNFFPGVPQGQYLRGREVTPLSFPKLASKVFYNTYNFLKSPDRILPVGILAISLIGFTSLSHFSVYSLFLLILMASLTLPNARYIHPILPLFSLLFAKNLPKKPWSIIVILLLLVPVIGKLTLDQKYVHKPIQPIYKQIADQMAGVLPPNQVIVTNLDAWAAWYHGLTTVWFPNTVEYIKSDPPEYIAISDYLSHDADFAINDWQDNSFIKNHYIVLKKTDTPDYKLTIWQKKP